MVFVKPLISNAQALLSCPVLKPHYRTGGPKIMLRADSKLTSHFKAKLYHVHGYVVAR